MKVKTGRWLQGAVLLIVILAIVFFSKYGGFFGTDNTLRLQKYSVTYMDAFDTVTQIMGYDTSEASFMEKAEKLHDRMIKYHQLFDIYNNYPDLNNLKTINDMAGQGPVTVSEEIIELLSMGKEVYLDTDGQVNIAMGSVLQVWHSYREDGLLTPEKAKLPELELLKEQMAYTNLEHMVVDREHLTVELTDEHMALDVGSLAKGYAADLLGDYAKELGFESILISIGGNIVAIGNKPDGSGWNVGIQNPFPSEEAKEYIDSVTVADVSVVTSGDYQRYYEVDGKRYCHIIDPDTLMPGEEFSSVTIIGPTSAMADALSTALFNMTLEEGQQLMKSLEGWEAMWVTKNGSIYYTDGFK